MNAPNTLTCVMTREDETSAKILLEYEPDKIESDKVMQTIEQIVGLAEENAGALMPFLEEEEMPAEVGKNYMLFRLIFTWAEDLDEYIIFLKNNKLSFDKRNSEEDIDDEDEEECYEYEEYEEYASDEVEFDEDTDGIIFIELDSDALGDYIYEYEFYNMNIIEFDEETESSSNSGKYKMVIQVE